MIVFPFFFFFLNSLGLTGITCIVLIFTWKEQKSIKAENSKPVLKSL